MVHLSNPFDGRQLCATVDKDWFFPDEHEDSVEVMTLKTMNAKAICMACPLTKSCLEYALKTPSLEGIWGGKTKTERRLLRRRLRARARVKV